MGQKLHNRIEAWKKLLLDFGKRNRLINFRESKRSSVNILTPSYETIFEKIAIREGNMTFPYSKKMIIDDDGDEVSESVIEGDFKTNKSVADLQKTLRVLRYRANTSIEEQGINILFLTFGMLKWKESDDSSDVLSSPIVLVPVKLTIESLTSPYVLSPHEDEIVVNPTLLHKLDNDFGIKFPDFDGTQDGISDYLDKCESVVENKGWTIDRTVHLTILSFLKINMYKDLERNKEKLSSHPIISAIAGEGDTFILPDGLNDYDHDKNERPINVFQVVDADASQQDAILLSKKSVSFVLQGPPGTGKSQTITNIISEALADGKKVLFVSEKMAALQVVYNRLSSVGLADFCFTLHSHKANKKEILRELANSISVNRKKVRDEALTQLDNLEKKRKSLNEYHEQLHTPCSALNITIFDVNGRLSKLKAVPEIIFPISDVEKTDIHELNNRKYLLGELSKTIGKRSEDYNRNVWRGAKIDYVSNELRHDIDSNVTELVPLLHSLNDKITECAEKLNLAGKHSLAGGERLVELLKVLKESPLIPERWLSDNIENLLVNAEECRCAASQIKINHQFIKDNYRPEILSVNCIDKFDSLLESEGMVLFAYSCSDKNKLVQNLANNSQVLCNNIGVIEKIFSFAEKTATDIGLEVPKCISELNRFEKSLNSLISILDVNPTESWFSTDKFAQIKASVSVNQQLHECYAAKVASVLENFDKEILKVDYYPILQRFRGEYDSFLRIFRPQYRKDIKLLRGFSRTGEKLNFNTAIATLNLLKEIAEDKERISLIKDQCENNYGSYYQGTDTQWDDLQNKLSAFELFVCDRNKISPKLRQLLVDGKLPLNDVIQFVDSYTSSDIDNRVAGIDRILLLDSIRSKKVEDLIEIVRHSISVSEQFLNKYNELKNYRNTDASYMEIVSDLNKIVSYQSAKNSIESKQDEFKNVFAFYYKGLDTNWDSLYQALCFAKDLKSCIADYAIPNELASKICSDSSCVDYCREAYEDLTIVVDSLSKPFNWFASLFEERKEFVEYDLLDLADYLMSCKNNKHQLEEWVDYQSNREKCAEAGLSSYIDQIDKMLIDSNYIVDAYLKRFYRLWLDKILPMFPAVRDFRSRIQEQNIREFNALDKEQFKIAQARVRERLVSRIPDFNAITTSRDEIGILKRELNKQRRIMPLRKLFKAIPNLLSALKPCFMMSPLSVSVFLEAQGYEFDMVVFDEASQVHTEDAIGAIMRGKQIIIVGDTKQLPPTSFFATSLNDEAFDIEDSEENDNDAVSYESILDEALTILPERSLQWHYRSRDEHLIAFSNIKIYNNSLITFPSAVEREADLGVEYVHVTNGVYDRGGKKNNIVEAKRVAPLLIEHIKKHPNRSLGVVTFSEAQQNAVDAALRQMRLNNSAYERFFADNIDEPFFIKNLENVQGDERDTIIFSIGYAKDNNGVMYMNFGPLSRDGGYRRLNVAITRAKYNVKLVGSIQATDIDLDKTSSEGVKLLRYYIEYAQQGIAALNKELDYNNDLNFDSPFEESVYDFLSAKGYEVVTQVGCSGYRIDMAVKSPTDSGKFAIGIECDGATYHSSRTARERDRLRQTVLEDMGWTLYRIWSTDWIKSQKEEENKLVRAIDFAISNVELEMGVEPATEQIEDLEIPSIEIEEDEEPQVATKNPYGFDYFKWESVYAHWKSNTVETIKDVVCSQQPIHFEALCRILAPLWGNQKATNVIRQKVSYYLNCCMTDMIKIKDEFVMLADFDNLKVRIPEDSNDIRPIEYISDDEIALALTTIANQSFGITPDALIIETARVYGFKRTGGKISATIQKVYDQLVADGKVKEVEGKVNVVVL